MRRIAFALLILGATACPVLASGTLIRARSFAWGCQFSASLNLLPQLESASQKDFDHIMQMLDSGHCMLIRAHQRLIVVQDQPTAYLAVRDMKRHGQWVGFVRKSYQPPYPLTAVAQVRLVIEAMRFGSFISLFQASQQASTMAS